MLDFLIAIVTFTAIYAMVSLGLNLQWGQAGLVNLGQVAFFATGAYTAAILTRANVPFLWAILAAAALAAVLGALVALITPHLREDYLAIVTLGFAELVRLILLNEKEIGNGPNGINAIPQPLHGVAGANYPLLFALLTLAALAAVFLFNERLRGAPLGRLLRAIRDDESVVASIGKSVLAFKVEAFSLGAAMAGAAGAFYAAYLTFIAPEMFTASVSIYVLVAVLIGKRGSNFGTLLGAVFVSILLEGSDFIKDYIPFGTGVQIAAFRIIVMGAVLMLVVLARYRTMVES
ncbi:branched-chain amino acid ABC transporter permease [bacterium]|nr:MAG: branched-chain amino acid ABC transporter permease [bacterium]